MTVITFVLLIIGLILLVAGAELLVKGASGLALMAGLSPLVIGLTIVAYGTSSPELIVSVQSSLANQADIALGNVVGSNIFNVLFILGISSLVTPLVVNQQLIRLDVPILIGVSALMLMFAVDGSISRVDGAIFFTGAIAYTVFQIWQSRREKNSEVQAEYDQEFGKPLGKSTQVLLRQLAYIGGGLLLLVLGSRWLVESSVAIARSIGVSELVIGLTLVAGGTSLPELATSVIASYRGERDIAVGNVIGSNIFNILAVLGGAALISPNGIQVSQAALHLDIPVMLAVAIVCLPIFITGRLIARWEGLLFVAYYGVYTIYLVLDSTNHSQIGVFSNILLFLVIPATLVAIGISVFPYLSQSKGKNTER